MNERQHGAAVTQLRALAAAAGYVGDIIRFVLPHESADMRKFMAHGGGDSVGRLVDVDVRLRQVGKDHTGELEIAHHLGKAHRLGTGAFCQVKQLHPAGLIQPHDGR